MTMASPDANILGPTDVKTGMASLAAYAIGGKAPAEFAQPCSAAEAVEIVRRAGAENRAIVVAGARTKLEIGKPPTRYDIAFDMTRMDRVISYDPDDLTLSVEPGITIAKLSGILAEHKQMLPLGVPFAGRTTVGGTIASGVDAPQRQLYGTPRDYLLGAEFVTGDGVLAKSGGRVVKNVTGYDMHKLLIGSLGTLGVITKLNFKTFPTPTNVRGLIARFLSFEDALDMRNRIAQSALAPMTLDIFSPDVARLFSSEAAAGVAKAPMPADVLTDGEWALTSGYSGNDDLIARYEADLKQMAEASGATAIRIVGDTLPAAWARKREFIPIALASSPATTIVKIGVLPSKISPALRFVTDAAAKLKLPWTAMARGVGVIYVAIAPASMDETSRVSVTDFVKQLQSFVATIGGSCTVPWCPAAWKTDAAIWGTETPDWAEMRKIKSAFDPKGILSPGRFVGGI
jgi:glycolate oxidase FAD binding subunit